MVARGEKGGEMSEIGEEDQEVQTTSYKINKSWDIIYSVGNIVNYITTLCGDRW